MSLRENIFVDENRDCCLFMSVGNTVRVTGGVRSTRAPVRAYRQRYSRRHRRFARRGFPSVFSRAIFWLFRARGRGVSCTRQAFGHEAEGVLNMPFCLTGLAGRVSVAFHGT